MNPVSCDAAERSQARAADNVRVGVRDEGEGVRVCIEDDGKGFDPAILDVASPGHLGLASMRERAELAGGWLRIETVAGQGTQVEFWVPHAERRPAAPADAHTVGSEA
jgi:nitrate/nitrite-specific signal transduction histidine kinase